MSISPAQREELRNLIRELLINPESDVKSNKLGAKINSISPDPDILGYIFWPHRFGITADIKSHDERIEVALNKVDHFKPVVLGS